MQKKRKSFVWFQVIIISTVFGTASFMRVKPERKINATSPFQLKDDINIICRLLHSKRCRTTTSSPATASSNTRPDKTTEHPTTRTETRSKSLPPGPTERMTNSITQHTVTSPASGLIVISPDNRWQISRQRAWDNDDERFLILRHGPLPDGVHLKQDVFSPIQSSRVGCAAHCLQSHACLAFAHSRTSQLCQLIDVPRVFTEHLAFDVGWKMYHV